MPSKGKAKYDYTKQKTDAYGVDAPDFRESEAYKSIVLKVTGIVYQFGDVSAGQIERLVVGDMPKGSERRRLEGKVRDALESLLSARIIEKWGSVQWVKYRKAEPVTQVEPIIDSERVNAYKQYLREHNGTYPAFASHF